MTRARSIDPNQRATLEILYKACLDALRHREQESLRFMAIIGPALAGFVWLLTSFPDKTGPVVFVITSLGLILIMLLGAVYCAALSYHYRYLVANVAQIERELKISDRVLPAWPRDRAALEEKAKLWGTIRWCSPPEVIKAFWLAFLVLIGLLTIGACAVGATCAIVCSCVPVGVASLGTGGIVVPHLYGRKLHRVYEKLERN